MGNATVTVNKHGNNFTLVSSGDPQLDVSGTVIKLHPDRTDSVFTVTLTPGTDGTIPLSFTNSFSFPSALTNGNILSGSVSASPGTVSLSSGQYLFTLTDRLTAGEASVLENFTVSVGSAGTFFPHDPSIIFNPPE